MSSESLGPPSGLVDRDPGAGVALRWAPTALRAARIPRSRSARAGLGQSRLRGSGRQDAFEGGATVERAGVRASIAREDFRGEAAPLPPVFG